MGGGGGLPSCSLASRAPLAENRDAEHLSFPLERKQQVHNTSAGSLAALQPRTELEKGIDKLLQARPGPPTSGPRASPPSPANLRP